MNTFAVNLKIVSLREDYVTASAGAVAYRCSERFNSVSMCAVCVCVCVRVVRCVCVCVCVCVSDLSTPKEGLSVRLTSGFMNSAVAFHSYILTKSRNLRADHAYYT